MSSVRTSRYGPHAAQAAYLHASGGPVRAVVCLLHGGFWRVRRGRDQLDANARDLAPRGYAAWNPGYRRIRDAGGGFPGTPHDVDAGLDSLLDLPAGVASLARTRVVVAGHSAGAQLALWSVVRMPARHATRSRRLGRSAIVSIFASPRRSDTRTSSIRMARRRDCCASGSSACTSAAPSAASGGGAVP